MDKDIGREFVYGRWESLIITIKGSKDCKHKAVAGSRKKVWLPDVVLIRMGEDHGNCTFRRIIPGLKLFEY